MLRTEAERRLETIVNASKNDVYDYKIIINEWNNYGKSRTYFSIIETRKNSKHHVERRYGYIDNETDEYVAGKNDLTENFTFAGARFEEETEFEETKRFESMDSSPDVAEIARAKEIIRRAETTAIRNKDGSLMTNKESKLWKKNYNDTYNEGGEGYVPEVITAEMLEWAEKVMKEIRQ